ncbi:hypothetical protein ACFQDD_08070 [Halorubrum pallidum]|uniref:Uncharacterized protein n=1 Tax=Halorubrum pallidum TaxID=1526114 RepID=A0ABD5T7D3_9EURY
MAASESNSETSEAVDEQESYNVVVDFGANTSIETIEAEFPNAVHVEQVGQGSFQIGYGTRAAFPAEAYRKVVNLVETKLELVGVDPVVETAHVYGANTKRVFGGHTDAEIGTSFD